MIMGDAMRGVALLAAAALLGGCNMVTTSTPLFAVEAGSPKLKPGVWATPDAACVFDPNEPAERWPSCASFPAG